MQRAVFFLVGVALAACSPAAPQAASAPAAEPTSEWRSPRPKEVTVRASVPAGASVSDLARAMAETGASAGLPCPSPVFVWGDVRVPASARPILATAGSVPLEGWLACESDIEGILRAERDNPRLKSAHGGAADLRWADDHLLLRRSWSKGEAALGDLSAEPSSVLQKGELLAVIFAASDPRAPAERVAAALRRVPTYFLFGMWPLQGR